MAESVKTQKKKRVAKKKTIKKIVRKKVVGKKIKGTQLKRSPHNPIIEPRSYSWESEAVFNPMDECISFIEHWEKTEFLVLATPPARTALILMKDFFPRCILWKMWKK